ncbi:MAG: helix-turn-helix domain-containing protein [Candidatus Coproplasma sp.]
MNDIIYAGKPPCDGQKNHNHKGYEIYVCTARGEIVTDGGVKNYKRGDVAVIPALLKHFNTGSGTSTEHHVIIEPALLSLRDSSVISGRGAEELSRACAQADYYFNADFSKKQVVLDGLGALICALITAYSEGNDFSPVVKTVMEQIDAKLSDPTFSLENSIKGLPLNYDYVRKLFKKEAGVTPHEYLTSRRMELAKNVILSGIANQYSNYTVSQIAEMCGYAEPLYFSRVFKKFYGVAPSEYRG